MPIYEYRCADCGSSFEVLVSITRPEAECPRCHGVNLARELSVFAASRSASDESARREGAAPAGGAGCCGGACGCRV